MGVLSIVNACSHLHNMMLSRASVTSLPNYKYSLQLLLAFQRAGLVTRVARGGTQPPTDAEFEANPSHGLTYRDPQHRRLWVKLKYWADAPVMRTIKVVSSPKRRHTARLPELEKLCLGRHITEVPGLTVGEMLFLGTDHGVMEAREAIRERRGGLLLCRVQC